VGVREQSVPSKNKQHQLVKLSLRHDYRFSEGIKIRQLRVNNFFFSAEMSEISPKTGFTGGHRYFLIPTKFSGIQRICLNFKNFDKVWTNLELCLTNLGRYLPVFRLVFPIFPKTGLLATYRYIFPSEEKNPWSEPTTLFEKQNLWHKPATPVDYNMANGLYSKLTVAFIGN
jgi:hypothetical protein